MSTVNLPILERVLPEGFTMRPVTMEDAEAIATIYTAASAVRGDNETTDPDALREDWTSPDFDLAHSGRALIAPDGTIAAHIEIWDTSSPPVNPRMTWEVDPKYDRAALAPIILAWGEARAREAIDRCPPDAKVRLSAGTLAGYAADEQILSNFGMKITRYFNRMLINMTEEPSVPAFPEGIILRHFKGMEEVEMIARTHAEIWRDHYGFVEISLDQRIERWKHWIESDKLYDPSLWFIGVDEATGEMAGLVVCRMEEYEDPTVGYISLVGVQRSWRKQGLALALLRHSLAELWKRGRKDVSLYVDASSPTGAVGLYIKAGMRLDRQYVSFEKELRPGIDLMYTGE